MRRLYNPNVPDSRTNDCLEITRRLYRGITDIAKRLDEQKGCALTITDVFTPSGEVLRAKLKDYCERLIFKDPVGHARKTEELLWRKGFYDAVSAAKKLRKGNAWSEIEKALLSSHLAVGVGFYHHLILKLQLECDLDLSGVIDFAYPKHKASLSSQKTKIPQNKLLSEEIRQCAIKIIHRSLICLGDLARYKLDLDPNWDPGIATRCYKMAISIDPKIGMPHNQLGTMAGNKNYGLDAVYHYTQCILCNESFEGAEGNLKRIIAAHSYSGKEEDPFEKCTARLFSLLRLWDIASSNSERINHDCQDLLVEFENCLSTEKREIIELKNIKDEDNIEIYLQNCKNEETSHLTDEMIFKMVAICLMSIAKLQSRDSGQVQGAIAFTLTILSQLMQITITRLQQAIMGICMSNNVEQTKELDENLQFSGKNARRKCKNVTDNGIVEESVGSRGKDDDERVDLNDNKNINLPKSDEKVGNGMSRKSREKSKSLLTKLRRPRKRLNSSDSEASDVDGPRMESSSDEMNSDISETDEEEDEEVLSDCNVISDDEITDDETPKVATNGHAIIDDDKKGKGDDDGEKDEKTGNDEKKISKCNVKQAANSDSSLVTATIKKNSLRDESENSADNLACLAQLKKQTLSPNDILDILGREGSLQSIKICFDWLRGNAEIFRMFAKSSGASLKRVVTFLNLINVAELKLPPSEFDRDSILSASLEKLRESTEKVPLPEDIDLRGLKLLDEAHKRIDWCILRNTRMSKNEETLLRARKLIDFGNYICTIGNSGIKYDETKKIFITSNVGDSSSMGEIAIVKTNGRDIETEHSRGKLMIHMGRLWLKAEVKALESRLRSRLISPYLVPDQEALARHTPALKRLVYAKKFIVIIPSVVVSALDEMKTTSRKAREATRWLEVQLRKGSRFLRAQRPHERLPMPLIKGPRTKDKEAWLFFQIIECCHYLTQQTKVGLNGDKEPPVVTLLTGFFAEERKAKMFCADGLAKTAGVNLEHVEAFHTKWRSLSKSHG